MPHEAAKRIEESEIDVLVLGVISKSPHAKIQVSLNNFGGKHRIDVRSMIPDVRGELVATKNGVSLPIQRLPALIDYLNSALREAKSRGFFEE